MPRYNDAGHRKGYHKKGHMPDMPVDDWSGPTKQPIHARKASRRRANAIARISRKRNRR